MHTPTGPRAIESLAVGDEVYSAESVLGRVVVRQVRKVESHDGEYPLVAMTFGGSGTPVYTTPGHHFLTPKGWAQAGAFSGEPVASRTGMWLPARLDESRGVMMADRVYNLVLDEPGGIFVGIDGVYASSNSSTPNEP